MGKDTFLVRSSDQPNVENVSQTSPIRSSEGRKTNTSAFLAGECSEILGYSGNDIENYNEKMNVL